MKPIQRWWWGFALAALMVGCTTPGGSWSPVGNETRSAQFGRFAVDLPNGWMRLSGENPGHIMLSRDGVNLQMIEMIYAKADNAFPTLKRGVPAGALASDLAELQLAEMRANPGTENLEIIVNEPANVAGRSGYMLHVRFKNPRGLRYERIVFGFTEADGYYTVTYQAPTLYYFPHDRAQFDALVHSLHAGGKPMSG